MQSYTFSCMKHQVRKALSLVNHSLEVGYTLKALNPLFVFCVSFQKYKLFTGNFFHSTVKWTSWRTNNLPPQQFVNVFNSVQIPLPTKTLMKVDRVQLCIAQTRGKAKIPIFQYQMKLIPVFPKRIPHILSLVEKKKECHLPLHQVKTQFILTSPIGLYSSCVLKCAFPLVLCIALLCSDCSCRSGAGGFAFAEI